MDLIVHLLKAASLRDISILWVIRCASHFKTLSTLPRNKPHLYKPLVRVGIKEVVTCLNSVIESVQPLKRLHLQL